MTGRAHHHWLDPVDASWAERASDADPRETGIVATSNGRMVLVPPRGSVPHQLHELTRARTSGTAATRNQQAYGSYGAAKEGPHERAELLTNGATPDEEYLREKSDEINLYG